MKNIPIRLRVALWFGLMVLLLANIFFFIAYKAVKTMVAEQIDKTFAQNSVTIEKNIYTEHGIPVFAGTLSPEMNYTIYASDNKRASGENVAWINDIPKASNGKIQYVSRPEGCWNLYDTDLYSDGKYIGFARLFFGPNQYIYDSPEKIYISLYLYFMISGLVIVLLVGGWIVGRVLKSLKKITAAAVEIGAGDLAKRINWNGAKDEIGILANTLDNMAGSLQKTIEWEKQFTSDVSHELRTPVASIITNAENAEYRDDIEIYRLSIKNILAKSRQM